MNIINEIIMAMIRAIKESNRMMEERSTTTLEISEGLEARLFYGSMSSLSCRKSGEPRMKLREQRYK